MGSIGFEQTPQPRLASVAAFSSGLRQCRGNSEDFQGLKTINEGKYHRMLRVDPESIWLLKKPLTIKQVRAMGIRCVRVFTPIEHDKYLEIIGLSDPKKLIAAVKEDRKFDEGREQEVVMTKRERSPALKIAAIERYGRDCMVCNYNFDSEYGKYSEGYIEIHHLNPISLMSIGGKTRLKEVIVTCSNCHRIIHRHKQLLDWRELRTFLKGRQSQSA